MSYIVIAFEKPRNVSIFYHTLLPERVGEAAGQETRTLGQESTLPSAFLKTAYAPDAISNVDVPVTAQLQRSVYETICRIHT